MRHSIYWADLDAPSGGADLYVNDLPVIRLGEVAAERRAINEYIRGGRNLVEVRRGQGRPLAAGDPPQMPPVKLLIRAVDFDDLTELAQRIEITAEQAIQPGAPPLGARLYHGEFEAPPRAQGLDLEGLQPIGPGERERVMGALERLAGWWRTGDAESIAKWHDGYVRDYTRAYVKQDPVEYRTDMIDMVKAMHQSLVALEFDRSQVRLEVCGGGRLVDCLRIDRPGSAIVVRSDAVERFNVDLVVGVRNGEVVPFR